jgi:hypothetical protein
LPVRAATFGGLRILTGAKLIKISLSAGTKITVPKPTFSKTALSIEAGYPSL